MRNYEHSPGFPHAILGPYLGMHTAVNASLYGACRRDAGRLTFSVALDWIGALPVTVGNGIKSATGEVNVGFEDLAR